MLRPIIISYGSNLNLSDKFIPTLLPLVWNKEPWGNCSNTEEPTFTKVAPLIPDNPDCKIAFEKVEDAIVDPAVDDAAAKVFFLVLNVYLQVFLLFPQKFY